MQHPQKITLGEMRAGNGPRLLIVYCGDHECAHSVIINAERWPDHVRLSDLEPKFICGACGHRGADIRPLFEPAHIGTSDNDIRQGPPPFRTSHFHFNNDKEGWRILSNNVLAKLVVTVIILISFAIWRSSDRIQPLGCGHNCPTDISASRR
jgi:hypothetical protein